MTLPPSSNGRGRAPAREPGPEDASALTEEMRGSNPAGGVAVPAAPNALLEVLSGLTPEEACYTVRLLLCWLPMTKGSHGVSWVLHAHVAASGGKGQPPGGYQAFCTLLHRLLPLMERLRAR